MTSVSVAQTNNVLTVAEQMPEFPGGNTALAQYLGQHIQIPPIARETGHFGKAYVRFVVDTNGKVISPEIIKSAGYTELNEEAVRVVKSMPNWNPGIDSGRKVNVSINLPIKFGEGAVADNRPTGFSMGNPQSASSNIPKEKGPSENEKKAVHFNNLGVEQARQERYEFALAKFDLSLKYDSTYRIALFNKAEMHLKLAQKQKACETWGKYKALGYKSEKVEDLIKQNCN